MIDAISKSLFSALASSKTLKSLASRYGMRRPDSFAHRFIAGDALDEAIEAARRLEARGLAHSLDFLGESVSSEAEAERATATYTEMIARIEAAGIGRNLSLKLTQLGLDLGDHVAERHLRRILQAAAAAGRFFVRIDMENSPYTDQTLDIWERVWRDGLTNVGVVLQSALKRTPADLERVMAAGGRIRLVKGAYREPPDVAYQLKSDVDDAYVEGMKTLLVGGQYPAIATHDTDIITEARVFAAEHSIAKDRFEFQMLYGIRRDLQTRLVREGYRVRVYVPFGAEWFPYFMRRLGERPANVAFVLRSLWNER
jgi:proline dehydrogenase